MEVTVALPLYNSKEIAWLALESLKRQKGVDFKWELVVMEEQNGNHMGEEKIKEYGFNLTYIPLKEKIALSQKWKRIAEIAKGKYYILQAGDCYSQPFRLQETVNLLRQGHDWVQSRKGLFYDVNLKKEILFHHNNYGHPCALNMATTTQMARKLKDDKVNFGVDMWFYRTISPRRVGWNDSPNWIKGFDSNGRNSISNRDPFFANPRPPYESTDLKIKDHIPAEIFNRL